MVREQGHRDQILRYNRFINNRVINAPRSHAQPLDTCPRMKIVVVASSNTQVGSVVIQYVVLLFQHSGGRLSGGSSNCLGKGAVLGSQIRLVISFCAPAV